MTRTAPATNSGDKIAAMHEQITEGVAALVDSDAWRDMLKTAARFHNYSLSNLLLIAVQRPDATRVAGFRTWQSLGRQVRKGEKGIAILAPVTYRPTKTDSTAPVADADAPPTATDAEPTKPGKPRPRGFKAAYVFDVAQTDGDPLPDAGPALLTGQAPAGLWDALAAQVTAHGYTVERGPCGGANGYTDPVAHVVRVRGDVDDAQAVKTLAHELGHIQCGHVTDLATYATCRDRCETEAESVAYIVCAARDVDASGYTFGYIAGWSGGDVDKVRAAADTVVRAARTILAALDTEPDPDQPITAAGPAVDLVAA
ncbi:ArdC-like ssDNA-binding domain-containing protein [uncultured Cellulomonas sp.]|uniref:ArdC-like ssDNA-binding domain-containing protein n=1 Tax=uncultured Cellulomonas sp. TaxID=189682 RepID=UPI0026079DFC|nr:ArdC-like ssDNA-binding domain-containing protein [uncultured Cellulomonas sp.]